MKIMDEESLQQLRGFRYGWINPLGEVTTCNHYGHVAVLRRHADKFPFDLESLIEGIESLEARSIEEKDEYSRLLDDESESGWHNFDYHSESKIGQLREHLMTWLYRNGWMRLGMTVEYLEAEGCPSVLNRNANYLEDAAIRVGISPLLTPTRFSPGGSIVPVSSEAIRNGLPSFYTLITERSAEKQAEFFVGWKARLDAFRPEMLSVRLPGLIELSPRALVDGQLRMHVVSDEAPSWKWQGPFPEELLADVRTHYFAELPDREALRTILREAGAEDIGPTPGALLTR